MAKGKKTGGRKKGSLNKRTLEIRALAEIAANQGVSPVDLMYKNMIIWDGQADSAEAALVELSVEAVKGLSPEDQFNYLLDQVKKVVGFRQLSQQAARDLAPYKHPKLATITHQGDDDKPVVREIRRIIVRPNETTEEQGQSHCPGER
jgi:hypothetical protein